MTPARLIAYARARFKVVASRIGAKVIRRYLGLGKDEYVHAGQNLPMERIPVMSTKRGAKKEALMLMRKQSGDNKMGWKRARKRVRDQLHAARRAGYTFEDDAEAEVEAPTRRRRTWWEKLLGRQAAA